MTQASNPATPSTVGAEPVHVDAHAERQRNRHANREGAPRALLQGVHHGEPETGERDDDDEEDGNGGRRAGDGADLCPRDLGERRAAAAGGGPENDHVVHGARQADAAHEPNEPGRVAELRREHRTDERPRPGNRGEVVAEEDPPGRDVIVLAVGPGVRRSGPCVVEHHDPRGDERAVIAERDGQEPENRNDDIERAHLRAF